MTFETLVVERDRELPGLMTVTLKRPEKLNSINVQMHDDLQQVCRDLQDDYETRVVILTGAGRAFSSGADLSSVRAGQPANDLDRRLRVHAGGRTSAMLERLDQVTIAAINGLAIGGAVVFASCMDLRIAAKSAWFSIPEVELDLPLTWQALPRLMRELGPARTKELVMTCDRFSSAEALQWGFLNRVVADTKVMAESRTLAAKLLSMDPLTLAMTKSATSALARLMVPEEVNWSDADVMLLSYKLRRDREKAGAAPRAVRRQAPAGGGSRSTKSTKGAKGR
jgi:enoyl-CoA hydratase/carnithine racemase